MGRDILRPATLLGLLCLVGCAAPASAPPSPRVAAAGDPPTDHAPLLFPADIVLADRALGAAGEIARRDASLGVGALDAPFAVPHYVGEVAPSLSDARSLYLNTDPRRVLYFDDARPRHHRRWYPR